MDVTGRAAIVFDSERSRGGRLAYAELAADVARLARGLRELGIDPERAAVPSALANPAARAYFGRFRGNPRGS